jgi:hypothetical protein
LASDPRLLVMEGLELEERKKDGRKLIGGRGSRDNSKAGRMHVSGRGSRIHSQKSHHGEMTRQNASVSNYSVDMLSSNLKR